jgi:SAM-dependent methyltransferase
VNFIYNPDIYNTKSAEEIVPLLMQLVNPSSVLDVGCGLGTWLQVFEKYGVKDYKGVDQQGSDTSILYIDPSKFISADLAKPLRLNKKYDLVVSLEVAEHIPETAANIFIENLINHGDIILFSAAVPFQEGQRHLNEQWIEYWTAKFSNYDYQFYDIIRKQIWNNPNIDYWYKQNMFMVAHSSLRGKLPEAGEAISIIHPFLYLEKAETLNALQEGRLGIGVSINILFRSLMNKIIQQ